LGKQFRVKSIHSNSISPIVGEKRNPCFKFQSEDLITPDSGKNRYLDDMRDVLGEYWRKSEKILRNLSESSGFRLSGRCGDIIGRGLGDSADRKAALFRCLAGPCFSGPVSGLVSGSARNKSGFPEKQGGENSITQFPMQSGH